MPCPGTLLSLQTVRSGVLAETATMSEALPARLCLQAPANPGAKSQYTSWDPQQALQESHTPISQPVVQVYKHSRKPQQPQVMSYNQEHKRRYIYPPPFLSRCLLCSCPQSIPLGLHRRDSPATFLYKAAQGLPGQPDHRRNLPYFP